MTAHVNLLRDGWEAAAERLSRRMRHEKGRKTLVVRPNGKVAVMYPHDCEEPPENIVGTYDKRVRIEHLEDDLLVRLREIQAA